MVRACHTPRQPLQNHPSGHLGGWATPWSAEGMLDGQQQRVNIPAHARTAHNGLRRNKLEENLCWIVPHVPSTTQSVEGLNRTELNTAVIQPKLLIIKSPLYRPHSTPMGFFFLLLFLVHFARNECNQTVEGKCGLQGRQIPLL